MNEKKFKIIKNNLTFIITVLTTIVIALASILKFIEYVISVAYFSYYGLDINLYDYSANSYVYYLVYSCLFILASYSVIFYVGDIYQLIVKRVKTPHYIFKIIVVLFSNIYFISLLKIEISILTIFLGFVILIITEYILYCYLKKEINSEKENFKQELIDYFKSLPIIIAVFLIALSAKTYIYLKNNHNYKIINDNKVIVYSNNNYYLLLDCKIESNKLIIYKGKQEKILNNNISSSLMNFDEVELIYE